MLFDWVPGSETELNRTQFNAGVSSIGSSEPIQSKPIKAGFSCALLLFIQEQKPQNNLTEQNKAIIIPAGVSEIAVPFPFWANLQ